MNRDLDEFVQAELTQSSAGIHELYVEPRLPGRLFYPCDAVELDSVVRRGAVRALDWRLGLDGILAHYGVELARSCLRAACAAPENGLRGEFRQYVLAHFDPRGTHFDGFVTRLFDMGEDVYARAGLPSYALGLTSAALAAPRTAGSPAAMRLYCAIYSSEKQRGIVQALHRRYEDYFVNTVARFGERHVEDLLPACTDRFRCDIGTFLMRFREPGSCHEREWIAIALASSDGDANPIQFDIRENRFVPVAALNIADPPVDGRRRLPIDVVAIGASLPAEPTREVLRAYLRRHGLAQVAVEGVNPLS
jgi:hypothetical protein